MTRTKKDVIYDGTVCAMKAIEDSYHNDVGLSYFKYKLIVFKNLIKKFFFRW